MVDCETITNNLGDLEQQSLMEAMRSVQSAEEARIAVASLANGMNIVNDRFNANEYFVGELIYAGELMKQALGMLKPLLLASLFRVWERFITASVTLKKGR